MYAGSGTNNFDLLLEPTQELFVILVTLHRVCSVTSGTLHKSLFCHFVDLIQKFFLIYPLGDLQGQLSVRFYKASYRSVSTGPVIRPVLQGQLSVHFFRASDLSISSGVVFSGSVIGLSLSA